MVLRQHGSAWCLRIDLSLLQRQSTSQENSEPPDIFQHQSTGYRIAGIFRGVYKFRGFRGKGPVR